MDCTNLANDIAQAFALLMDSWITVACGVAFGCIVGAAPSMIDRFVDWNTRRKARKA